MSTQLIALLMFLLLTYLLFRRPASAATGRYPTELNIRVRHSSHLKSEFPMESAASSSRSGMNRAFLRSGALGLALIAPSGAVAMTQTSAGAQVQLAPAGNDSKTVKEDRKESRAANDRAKTDKDNAELLEEMRQLIERLEARINRLEAEMSAAVKPAPPAGETQDANVAAPSATPTPEQTSALSEGASKASDFFRDTTISGTVDGYYGYNFNRPVGRINLLRAYDVASNSFSLNQAVVSVERAPDVNAGRRFGMRLDLMYGQATETVQGNLVIGGLKL